MSEQIQTSHPDIVLTEFFGGMARGTCIQINTADKLAESDSIQLTKLQAEALALALIDWLTDAGWPSPSPLALKIQQRTLPVSYATAADAERALLAEGWEYYHAGNWRHARRPGFSREVRRPNQGAFRVVEWYPMEEPTNA